MIELVEEKIGPDVEIIHVSGKASLEWSVDLPKNHDRQTILDAVRDAILNCDREEAFMGIKLSCPLDAISICKNEGEV